MDYEDLNCSLCNTSYDDKKHIPRMLIHCGHTYCQECLINILDKTKENSISCPEDNTKHDKIKKVDDIPKNLTLINLIKKAHNRKNSRTYTEQKRTSIQFLNRSSIPRGGKNYFTACEENNSNNNSNKEDILQSDSISRKSLNNLGTSYNTQNYPFTTEFSLNESSCNPNYFCSIHRRPLEIACLDHKIKVCTSCALFGEHKHHNLKSEDDIIKEVTIKAERLIELYESVEKQAEIFENNLSTHQISVEETKSNLKQINDKIKEKSKMFFKELRFLLKAREKEIIEKLDEKLESTIEKKFDYVNKLPEEMRKKTTQWKKEVQDYLDNLNNVNESYEILFQFLENKNDLVTPAENLITDIESAAQVLTIPISNPSLYYDIDCNFDLFNSYYDKLCIIKENHEYHREDLLSINNLNLNENTNTSTPLKKEEKLCKDTSSQDTNHINHSNHIAVTPKKINYDENENLEIDIRNRDAIDSLFISQKSSHKITSNVNTNIHKTDSKIEEDNEENQKGITLLSRSNINYPNSTGDLFYKNQNNVNDQKSIFNSPNHYSNTCTNFDNSSYSTYHLNYNPLFTDTSFMSIENDNNYTTFFRESKPVNTKNKLMIENSFTSETRLNTTTSVTNNRKPSINSLTTDKVVFIKNQLKNEVANFTGYSIADEGAKKISEILLANQYSQSQNKKLVINKIKELKLTKIGLSDEGFSYITNSVSKINQIHSISVNKNKLKDVSCVDILNLIKRNKNLKYLNLSMNYFSSEVKDKIRNISKNLNPNLKIEI